MAIWMATRRSAHGTPAIIAMALWCLAVVLPAGDAVAQPAGPEKIQHVIVIYQENWSFDGLCGKFPGASGIANVGERIRQLKKDGAPHTALPQLSDSLKAVEQLCIGHQADPAVCSAEASVKTCPRGQDDPSVMVLATTATTNSIAPPASAASESAAARTVSKEAVHATRGNVWRLP